MLFRSFRIKLHDFNREEPYTDVKFTRNDVFSGNDPSWLGSCLNIMSVSQFSRSVVSSSLLLHEPQHARPPCPWPTSRVHPNSCPLSRWCHPTISCSVIPFSSCPQSFPASGSFQMSQFFASGTQVLEFQLQHQFFQWIARTDLLYDGLVGSPCSPRDSQVFFTTTVQKHQFFCAQLYL